MSEHTNEHEHITYSHDVHGVYRTPADVLDAVTREHRDVFVSALRELAEDATDGDTDLSDVTSRSALLVIVAALLWGRSPFVAVGEITVDVSDSPWSPPFDAAVAAVEHDHDDDGSDG